jgi:tetratricopeptide (TPR) repeat protein
LEGLSYQCLHDNETAKKYFQKAIVSISAPVQAIFYNDQQPDKILYQGLALNKLGKTDAANKIFEKLISFGQDHSNDHIKLDYFAVSLPDLLVFDGDLNKANVEHCNYLIGLGYLGLADYSKALECFEKVLALNVNHLGAIIHKKMANKNSIINL